MTEAWREAYERGRALGAADRAAGRRPADWSEDEQVAAAGATFGAFWSGYGAGREPDKPALAPAPLVVSVPAGALAASLTAWVRDETGRWDPSRLAVLVAVVAASIWPNERAREWRARREGFDRRADAPPPRPAPGALAWSVAFALERRVSARRRGVWPPSAATLFGLQLITLARREQDWRRNKRAWTSGREAV